jgi:membrane protease YdiL (CAAX protease family)
MATIAAPSIEISHPTAIAPWWHTALLIGLFVAVSAGGARLRPGTLQRHPNMAPLYLSLIVAEWGLVYYVWKGGTKLRSLIGGRWTGPKDVLVDASLGLALWALWEVARIAWVSLPGHSQAASIHRLLPQGAMEIALWVAVSLSAGFAEELVFRGYFQKQFEALTRSNWAALLMQGALFGIAHGYQGFGATVAIAFYGVLFGLLAIRRGSLRPVMIAHGATDILVGVFGI